MTKSIKEKNRIRDIRILNDKNIDIEPSMLKLRIRYRAVDLYSSYGGSNFDKRMKNKYYNKIYAAQLSKNNYIIKHFINIKNECKDIINLKIRENLIEISNTLKIYDWNVTVKMSKSNQYLYNIQILIENKKHKIKRTIHTYNNKENLHFVNNYDSNLKKENTESILHFHGSFFKLDDIKSMQELFENWRDTTLTLNKQNKIVKLQNKNINSQHKSIIDIGHFHKLTKFKYISFIATKSGVYYQLNYELHDYMDKNIINSVFFNIDSLAKNANLVKNLVFLNVFGNNIKINELQSSDFKELIKHIQLISY